jgi:hypothetical protein
MRECPENFGFAPAHDEPIPYRQRIRDYYVGLGYGTPYAWAHYAEVPFHRLRKPLGDCRLTLVTTAAPYQPDKGDQGPGAPYNSAAKFYTVYSGDTAKDHDLRISHVGIDRKHTTAEDPGSYFALAALVDLPAAFTDCRQTAAIASPSRSTARSWSRAARRMASMPRCCCPTVRSVTKVPAWRRAPWKVPALPQW